MDFNGERRAAALRRANHSPGRRVRFVRDQVRTVFCAALVFLLIRSFLVEGFRILSGSMEGTVLAGDFLLVNKLVYGAEVPFLGARTPRLHEPQRGDIIVFQWPADLSTNFVKRVVGVPGDTLAMRDSRLVLNGVTQSEWYTRHSRLLDRFDLDFRWQRHYLARPRGDSRYRPSRDNWGPIVVPRANYFVLGDNRENSLDSRYWGFVPDSLVRGRPFVVYYSFDPQDRPQTGWLSRVRWRRVGALVQ